MGLEVHARALSPAQSGSWRQRIARTGLLKLWINNFSFCQVLPSVRVPSQENIPVRNPKGNKSLVVLPKLKKNARRVWKIFFFHCNILIPESLQVISFEHWDEKYLIRALLPDQKPADLPLGNAPFRRMK
jgi:hypothetical protein